MGLPRHRIDGEMVYISRHDTAWDHERIKKERAALKRGESHPWDSWVDGESRFDEKLLPSEYLLEGETPVRFRLRRLERNLSSVLRDQIGVTSLQTRACIDAFANGVKSADGLDTTPDVIDWPGNDARKRLGPGDLDALEKHMHLTYMADVGLAVLRANWELTESEKKP